MKAIVCEMCGSHDLIKKDGVFVCENCGTKYTLEEARKLMIEGVVSVSIDTSKKEKDILKIIETAYSAWNHKEVYEAASKLVEMNPSLWKGWFYKGLGAGYLSENDFDRFGESLTYFDQALKSCDEDEYKDVEKQIRDEMLKMIEYLFGMHCINFQTNSNEDSAYNMETFLSTSFDCINGMVEEFDYSFCEAYELKSKLADKYFETLKKVKHTSDIIFGKQKAQRTDEKFDRWIDTQIDLSANIKALLESEIRPQNFETYLDFFTRVVNDRIHGCSYEYIDGHGYVESITLTDESKRIAKNDLKEILSKKSQILADAQKRENEYHLAKNEKYWEEHKEEKDNLLEQKDSLHDSIKEIDDKVKEIDRSIAETKKKFDVNLPEEEKVLLIESQIKEVKCNIRKHSLFDFKGKAPHKEQLSQLKKQLNDEYKIAVEARKEYDSSIKKEINQFVKQKNSLLSDKESALNKINEINNELNKNR